MVPSDFGIDTAEDESRTVDDPDVEGDLPISWHINRICREFESQLEHGESTSIEDHLDFTDSSRDELLAELLDVEMTYRLNYRVGVDVAEYHERFPDDVDLIDRIFDSVKSEPFVGSCAHVNNAEPGRYELGE